MNNLLTAYGIMTLELVEGLSLFCTPSVSVVDSEDHVLHLGIHAPNLVMELLDWIKTSEVNMLIHSCVFHYELESIHPFDDGNGCVGRLWHMLLLSKWNPAFAWFSVESIIHDRQQEYYEAINASNDAGSLRYLLSSCSRPSKHRSSKRLARVMK